ncbi:hypothetical protein CNMCM5793_001634 [Aspergillus hiratsukae]|uniref:Uncharacterized protein n=1 Tax=Aspergillus hiratsukae TaxID=1194566 RepID=A0A8H6QDV8_9EURO|nr:hypothetical protein CNMCM5793_001634 [Aspergillus hiratsukae]KAF7170784.1 hypothetical protein CNMCM6106_005379 [Aspergillus hiratsukae]
MARFSLSFLALCFFLALMASALPAKRDDGDMMAADAVAAALGALKAFENADKENNNNTADKTSAAHAANVKQGTATPQPIPSGTRTAAQTPAAASSSGAAKPKKQSSSENMLAHIPLIGGVLGGGAGLGSLLPTR